MPTKKSNRGGKREGAGRKRYEKGLQVRTSITLSERLNKKAAKIGGGNVSEGIRRAITEYEKRTA